MIERLQVAASRGKEDAIMQDKKYMRLTSAERKSIEQGLKAGMSIKMIAAALGRSTSTVSREIMRNSVHRKSGGYGADFNDCRNRDSCLEERLCDNEDCREICCCGCKWCFRVCKKYERESCPALALPPYVCNGCRKKNKCTLEKVYYKATTAEREAEEVLRASRAGIDLCDAERRRLDAIISPLIKQGQSPYHICLTHKDELMMSPKTVYKYIRMGIFSVKSIDAYKMVKMKPRRTKRQPKIERQCRTGRTYEDFLSYLKEHQESSVVEIDTVIGAKGGSEKVLLTMQFAETHFMLAFIRDANTAKSVCEVFDRLDKTLGRELFEKLFPILLADNGAEFSNPSAIEADKDAVIRTRLFYCDPRCSFQKPHVENNHDFIRRCLPKGQSMNHMTQKSVNEMMSHINSYRRRSLSGRAPVDLFVKAYGIEVLKKLGLRIVPTKDIHLSPKYFK
jgi:IS30 family transposase